MLVAICISCMVKRRSKATPDEMPGVYEMVETEQMGAIAVEANSLYDSVRSTEAREYMITYRIAYDLN